MKKIKLKRPDRRKPLKIHIESDRKKELDIEAISRMLLLLAISLDNNEKKTGLLGETKRKCNSKGAMDE